MRELLENLSIWFWGSRAADLIPWADSESFLCWLLGHTDSITHGQPCERCGMGLYYFMNHCDKPGPVIAWRVTIMAGRVAEWIKNFCCLYW